MSSHKKSKIVGALAILLSVATARAQAPQTTPNPRASELNEAQVVSLAAEHNPGLKSTLLELESANWDVLGLESRYAPVLVLDASGSQVKTPSLVFDQININEVRRIDAGAELRKHLIWGTDLALRISSNYQTSSFSRGVGLAQTIPGMSPTGPGRFGPGYGLIARLSLKQPLLRGRGRDVAEADLLASRARRTTQEHTRDRVASQLLRDALSAYWELWYASSALRIEEQSRDVAVRQRDDAAARVNVGALAPADVLAFDTQVATREEAVLNARLIVQQRELELVTQLGLVDKRPALAVDAGAAPLFAASSRESAIRHALSQSSELKELEAQVALARLQQKTAADPQRSRLDLDAYVQTQGLGNQDRSEAVEQFGSLDVVSAFVGLTYEAPLTNRIERAQAAKARLAIEVAEQQLAQAKQRVLSEIELMLEREATGEQKVTLAERTVEIAERQLTAEQARFAGGSSTPLTVLEAENAVRNARIRVARARADLVTSSLSLKHLTGELVTRYAALKRR